MVEKHESGAALTETAVLLLVLLPLALGLPMIGKMIDLRQTTVQASRYAAWETTVHDRVPADLDVRFFGDITNPIDGSAEAPNALWGVSANDDTSPADASQSSTEPTEQSQVYYWSNSDVLVDTASSGAVSDSAYTADAGDAKAHDGPARTIGKLVGKLGIIADKTGGVWDENNRTGRGMQMDGLVRAEASATMQGNGWVDPLTFTQGTVIMNDNWSSANAVEARDRVRSLVPAGALKDIGKFLGYLGEVPVVKELKYFKHDGGRGVFGYVDMEPLPPSETEVPRPLKNYEEEE